MENINFENLDMPIPEDEQDPHYVINEKTNEIKKIKLQIACEEENKRTYLNLLRIDEKNLNEARNTIEQKEIKNRIIKTNKNINNTTKKIIELNNKLSAKKIYLKKITERKKQTKLEFD